MAALDATYVGYALLALLLVGGATWSLKRYSAPLLFDVVDADEMVLAAVHRLLLVGHVLLGAAVAVRLAPSSAGVHAHPGSALFGSLTGLLALLAVLHLAVLALFFRARKRRAFRAFGPPVRRPGPVWAPAPPGTVLIPGATPPTVPMAPPVFHAPRYLLPAGPAPALAAHPAWTFPRPAGPPLAAPPLPPFPPPWCVPVQDVWAPPQL